MFVCMHNITFFEGIMLAKTNPPLVKAGYGPCIHACDILHFIVCFIMFCSPAVYRCLLL